MEMADGNGLVVAFVALEHLSLNLPAGASRVCREVDCLETVASASSLHSRATTRSANVRPTALIASAQSGKPALTACQLTVCAAFQSPTQICCEVNAITKSSGSQPALNPSLCRQLKISVV